MRGREKMETMEYKWSSERLLCDGCMLWRPSLISFDGGMLHLCGDCLARGLKLYESGERKGKATRRKGVKK